MKVMDVAEEKEGRLNGVGEQECRNATRNGQETVPGAHFMHHRRSEEPRLRLGWSVTSIRGQVKTGLLVCQEQHAGVGTRGGGRVGNEVCQEDW